MSTHHLYFVEKQAKLFHNNQEIRTVVFWSPGLSSIFRSVDCSSVAAVLIHCDTISQDSVVKK